MVAGGRMCTDACAIAAATAGSPSGKATHVQRSPDVPSIAEKVFLRGIPAARCFHGALMLNVGAAAPNAKHIRPDAFKYLSSATAIRQKRACNEIFGGICKSGAPVPLGREYFSGSIFRPSRDGHDSLRRGRSGQACAGLIRRRTA